MLYTVFHSFHIFPLTFDYRMSHASILEVIPHVLIAAIRLPLYQLAGNKMFKPKLRRQN